jgi:hypothetical protein
VISWAWVGGLVLLAPTIGFAALEGRDLDGNPATIEAVYDPSSNLTWVANANLGQSTTFGVAGIASNGRMTWTTANQWIAAMNSAGHLGYADWRIPTTAVDDATCSPGVPATSTGVCRGSEMGHLFNVVFGANGTGPIYSSADPADLALLTNFPSGPQTYLSSEYTPNTTATWIINEIGSQSVAPKGGGYRVWPVRTGDVDPPPTVPTLGPAAGMALPLLVAAATLGSGRLRRGPALGAAADRS